MIDCMQSNIAAVLLAQNKLPEALAMNFEVLRIFEKVHGCEHLDVAKTQNNIAVIFQQQGKYPEALEMYHKSLATKEKLRGPEHLVVANNSS